MLSLIHILKLAPTQSEGYTAMTPTPFDRIFNTLDVYKLRTEIFKSRKSIIKFQIREVVHSEDELVPFNNSRCVKQL